MNKSLSFPKNFVWGVATAAPQIEGAAFEDGKGESIWDHYAQQPGKILNGDNLDVACDHYHLYKSDFKLMRKLGIKHYRLSIAWPRIFPEGFGPVNPKGIAFYDKLINAMIAEGITPWVTMFHWDLPQALGEIGGWKNRQVVDAFALYADTIVQAFGDRVKNWITLNEIRCFTSLAFGKGSKAPGTRESEKTINQSFHHAIVCHGHGVRAVRQYGGKGARVGLTDNSDIAVPLTETPEDLAAARKWFIERNAHILEPVYTGRYSAAYLKRTGKDQPNVENGDMELISLPTDFLGMNIYTGVFVRAGKRGAYEQLPFPPDYPRSTCPWLNILPRSIYWGPRMVQDVYGVDDIYITENGCGYDQEDVVDGEVLDLHRVDLVRNYLAEVSRAIQDGVPISGYFLWSFMDNFEWEDGYTRRFGIVHTDYATQKRTPKASALWYSVVMRENRVV